MAPVFAARLAVHVPVLVAEPEPLDSDHRTGSAFEEAQLEHLLRVVAQHAVMPICELFDDRCPAVRRGLQEALSAPGLQRPKRKRRSRGATATPTSRWLPLIDSGDFAASTSATI